MSAAPHRRPSPILSNFLGVVAILLWSTSVGVTRRLAESLGPVTSSAWVYLIGGLIGCALLAWRGSLRVALAAPKEYLVGCGALFVVYIVSFCLAIGLASTPQQVIEVGLINYLWPGLTLLFSIPVLGHRARPWLPLGLLLAFAGVYLSTFDEIPRTLADAGAAAQQLGTHFASEPVPYILALSAAVTWSLYSNFSRRFAGESDAAAVPLFLLASGAVLWSFGFFVEETSQWTGAVVLELGYMALLPALFAYNFWDAAMRFGSAVTIASLSYLIPLLSVLLLCWWQDVPMRASLWLACALLIAGAVLCRVSIQTRR